MYITIIHSCVGYLPRFVSFYRTSERSSAKYSIQLWQNNFWNRSEVEHNEPHVGKTRVGLGNKWGHHKEKNEIRESEDFGGFCIKQSTSKLLLRVSGSVEVGSRLAVGADIETSCYTRYVPCCIILVKIVLINPWSELLAHLRCVTLTRVVSRNISISSRKKVVNKMLFTHNNFFQVKNTFFLFSRWTKAAKSFCISELFIVFYIKVMTQ